MNNNTTNQENNLPINAAQSELVWEVPVLYKEEWMKTLVGGDPGLEAPGFFQDT